MNQIKIKSRYLLFYSFIHIEDLITFFFLNFLSKTTDYMKIKYMLTLCPELNPCVAGARRQNKLLQSTDYRHVFTGRMTLVIPYILNSTLSTVSFVHEYHLSNGID